MPAWLAAFDTNTWLMIAAGIYLLLPANSPIKAFINKILAQIGVVHPAPGPDPGPNPGPLDITTLLQLLMNILLKAKASGDEKTQAAVLETINAVQAEQLAMQKSAIPQSMFR